MITRRRDLDNRRECPRCHKKGVKPGDRYCPRCAYAVKLAMRRSGYLTPHPRTLRFNG